MDPIVTVIAVCCLANALERDIREDFATENAAKPTGPVLPKRGDISSIAPSKPEPPFDPTPPAWRKGIPPVIATYRAPHFYYGCPVNEHGQELEYHEFKGKVTWRVA